jgi:hypothetical protein
MSLIKEYIYIDDIREPFVGTLIDYRGRNIHRKDDGPAVCTKRKRIWFKHNEIHRKNKPAIIGVDGSTSWFYEGLMHRLNGPAVRYSNNVEHWFIHGKMFQNPEDHPFNLFRTEHNLSEEFNAWPVEMRVLFELMHK